MSVGRDQCAVYFIDVEIYVRKNCTEYNQPFIFGYGTRFACQMNPIWIASNGHDMKFESVGLLGTRHPCSCLVPHQPQQ